MVWLSVPTSVSGRATRPAESSRTTDALGQELEVHLVDDARARRNHAEVPQRLLAPTQELVPLAVPLELHRDVLRQGVGRAEAVNLHRVVDHQVDRHQRVDPLGIAAEPLHRAPHRRQIDTAGTPVKSWRMTRAGLNGTSIAACRTGCQPARLRTSSSLTW